MNISNVEAWLTRKVARESASNLLGGAGLFLASALLLFITFWIVYGFLWFIGFPAFALVLLTTLFRGVRIVGLVLSALVAVFSLIILIHFHAIDPQSSALKDWGLLQRVIQFVADNRQAIVVGSIVSLVLTIPFGRMWTSLRLALRKPVNPGSAKR